MPVFPISSPPPLFFLPSRRKRRGCVPTFALSRQTQSSLTLINVASRTNTTTCDYLGRATSIRQHGDITDEIFAEFTHNANGLLTSVHRYEIDDNNIINDIANTLYTYNAANAITSITHQTPSSAPIVQHSYTYDSANNILSYLNSLDGQTSYNYDFLGQLISADYSNITTPDESYTYDSNGNRLTANGSAYTTSTNNELTSDGTWSYVYDDEGNRISKQNSTNRELYTWDHRNRLTKVTQQEYNTKTQEWTTIQIIEYTYDYNNVWIRKTLDTNADTNADSKSIFIPENYQTTVQLDDTDLSDNVDAAVTHHYLWTPQHQDKLLADTTTDGVLWTLTDHLGSIRDIIQQTSSGLVIPAHIIYDAYGNIISCTNTTGQTVENPVLFAYTGKAFDTNTQLQNNVNRWYDATNGRWLSVDPIGFEGMDTNFYRYVGNIPVLFCDYLGFAPNPLKGPLKVYREVMKEVYNGLPGLSSLGVYQYWKVTDHEKDTPQEIGDPEGLARAVGWDRHSVLHLIFPSPRQKVIHAVERLQQELGNCYEVSHRFYGTVVYKKWKYRDDNNLEQICYMFNFTYYSELTIVDKSVQPHEERIERDILAWESFPLDSNGKLIREKIRGKFLY